MGDPSLDAVVDASHARLPLLLQGERPHHLRVHHARVRGALVHGGGDEAELLGGLGRWGRRLDDEHGLKPGHEPRKHRVVADTTAPRPVRRRLHTSALSTLSLPPWALMMVPLET